ncbi:SseB family protein [Xanthomonas albilineans]|uniref:SseB family protein n=1 Tax=Xanthomonas albilineans TaxID=29447 RepID=UPI0018B02C44|nr:SseB family protein [Xanthomonas albilineans]
MNDLERALISAKAGILSISEFVATLLVSELVVPSTTEIQPDGSGLTPLFFDNKGVGMLVAFTEKSRISEFTKMAGYCLEVKAFDLLKRIPVEYGVVINPGCDVGFDISPNGIREIIKDFD